MLKYGAINMRNDYENRDKYICSNLNGMCDCFWDSKLQQTYAMNKKAEKNTICFVLSGK